VSSTVRSSEPNPTRTDTHERMRFVRVVAIVAAVALGGCGRVGFGIAGVVAASAGTPQTCAVLGTGALWVWGDGTMDALGSASATTELLPVLFEAHAWSGVACAEDNFGCGLRDARVHCWGSNAHGQLGNGTTSASTSPSTVMNDPGLVRV